MNPNQSQIFSLNIFVSAFVRSLTLISECSLNELLIVSCDTIDSSSSDKEPMFTDLLTDTVTVCNTQCPESLDIVCKCSLQLPEMIIQCVAIFQAGMKARGKEKFLV